MKRRRVLVVSVVVVALLVSGCGLWAWKAHRQYTLNRQLIAALKNNDSRQAIALVKEGADPNTRYDPPPFPTPQRLLYQLLRRAPAPVNESPTAFLLACGTGFPSDDEGYLLVNPEDVTLVEVMLAHGADCNLTDPHKQTALIGAAQCNYYHVAQRLVEHGAKVNVKSSYGMTPILFALQDSHTEMVRLLLEHGVNVSVEGTFGVTLLDVAVGYDDNQEIIRLLLAHGADPNHKDCLGETSLRQAQKKHRPDIVALMRKSAKQQKDGRGR